MKNKALVFSFLTLASCTILLRGEKKLTYNESTLYIKSLESKVYRNVNFYIIPIEKIKECRGYPIIYYIGSENNYSFFYFLGKLKYKDEIGCFALPDSICINKYLHTMYDNGRVHPGDKSAKIMDNKMVVADN